MATKLKNLHIRKVDFVDEGANQRADIKIAKKKDADPETGISVRESTMKRFMRAIGKAVGITDDYLDALEDVQKGNSQTFGEKMTEVKRQKVADEMWSICYALQSSLQSILYDEDLDGSTAQSMMEKSVSEFDEIIGEAISSWSAGKVSGIKKEIGKEDVESLKKFRDHLNENIEKAMSREKGEIEEMEKIDKSKMSPEDRAAYEDILKKYGIEEEEEPVVKSTVKPGDNKEGEEEEDDLDKGCGKQTTKKSISGQAEPEEDIYKGLHPAVKAEIEALRKYRETAENREFMEAAKKYEVIGKKAEELAPVLKSLKAAGGTAYDDMISTLDSMVAMAENSGIFSEIGKSGHGSHSDVTKGKTEAQVENIAKGYMEKRSRNELHGCSG
ncbi:MAG: hypothetical protein ACLTUZ_15435 [Sellimonas intestinalis]|uniref:hypothetical protein n=1 Tax=Sellimonas intestinalis TaxID=1653434 RepID=UPI0039949B7C